MSEVVEITALAELDKAIADNDSVVVLFHAPSWCRPCVKFHPAFEVAAERLDDHFVEVDVDVAPEIAKEYGVMGVPSVKRIRKDEVTDIKARTAIPLITELGS